MHFSPTSKLGYVSFKIIHLHHSFYTGTQSLNLTIVDMLVHSHDL